MWVVINLHLSALNGYDAFVLEEPEGFKLIWLFSTVCDNFCLWNREMLTEKDFYDYFAEETISIGFVSTQKPEEP